MKVLFKKNIRCYSGLNDELVYQAFRKGRVCIGRDYVYPKLTENNHMKGKIVRNLASVYHDASEFYIDDLKTYAERNGRENTPKNKLIPTAFALFLKMMYAWYESDPEHIDLTTVTVADIVAMEAPVKTIAGAVEAEFLPYIRVSADLTAEIQ